MKPPYRRRLAKHAKKLKHVPTAATPLARSRGKAVRPNEDELTGLGCSDLVWRGG